MAVTNIAFIPVYPTIMASDSWKSRIFCHRGLWSTVEEQNSRISLMRAAVDGFSIETDLHTFLGKVTISHDLPKGHSDLSLTEVLSLECAIALNLKCDGLLGEIEPYSDLLKRNGSFVFDGSIPEMLSYRRKNVPLALRMSEFERELAWNSEIVWLDGFESDWWLEDPRFLFMMRDKTIVFVSPEIHGRDPMPVWNFLSENWNCSKVKFAICTDRPLEILDYL